jgi:hypothetical protein
VHRRGGRIWRGAALAVLVLLAAAAIPLPSGALAPRDAAADRATLAVQVGTTPAGQAMPPGFVGVSMEYKAMHLYTGRDPTAVNPALVQLLRALAPGQAPVLRIGGDSTDSTWWPMRGVIPPGGISYGLTKGWLRTTQALAKALGAKLIMGINLASGRPAPAATEARAILQGIGRQYIRALEIGNEPDLYGVFPWYRDRRGRVVFSRAQNYDLLAFINDFSRWSAALPTTTLAGPTFSSVTWLTGLQSFLLSEPRLGLVTFHRYPLRGCVTDPTSPSYASIPNLMGDQSSFGLAQQIAPDVAIAHARGIPFRLDELNSAACSGRRGVSNAFASALWVLDTLFNMASVGVDGINLHTLPGAAYEPFTFTRHGRTWSANVHPVYYGMLMFAQAFPPGARLLPVNAPGGAVKVWATSAPDGRTRVVLINKDPATSALVQLQIPGRQAPASAQSLIAPSISATSGVSFAGQTFGASTDTGKLAGTPRAVAISPVANAGTEKYSVQLPPASAMLLTR